MDAVSTQVSAMHKLISTKNGKMNLLAVSSRYRIMSYKKEKHKFRQIT